MYCQCDNRGGCTSGGVVARPGAMRVFLKRGEAEDAEWGDSWLVYVAVVEAI